MATLSDVLTAAQAKLAQIYSGPIQNFREPQVPNGTEPLAQLTINPSYTRRLGIANSIQELSGIVEIRFLQERRGEGVTTLTAPEAVAAGFRDYETGAPAIRFYEPEVDPYEGREGVGFSRQAGRQYVTGVRIKYKAIQE